MLTISTTIPEKRLDKYLWEEEGKAEIRFWAQGERREKRERDGGSWGPGPVQFGSHVRAPPTSLPGEKRSGLSGECSSQSSLRHTWKLSELWELHSMINLLMAQRIS